MRPLTRLWNAYRLPCRDGLYLATGASYAVRPSPEAPGGLRIHAPFDLAAYVAAHPGRTSEVDGLTSAGTDDGDLLWGGEGSYGSEGFAARLRSDRTLVWAVFLTDANPFTEIRTSGRTATFRSTSGVGITLDLDDPAGGRGET
ncbi:hypothetical protein [Streptomyces sp. MAR4 CNX-425]|uniref:hypothetical protein n=1 Tax=Streptomyces sp. MAR4 CNX-425 TaxID=3406343 RepID=UPI003B5111BA